MFSDVSKCRNKLALEILLLAKRYCWTVILIGIGTKNLKLSTRKTFL